MLLKLLQLVVICLLLFGTAKAQPPRNTFILIRAGKLYDSQKKVFLTNQDVLIHNDIIYQVGKDIKAPRGTKILNLNKCTITPGLIDAHTHLLISQKQTDTGLEEDSKVNPQERIKRGLGFAKQHLLAGITTVRDVGNSGQYLDIRLQKMLASDKALGPRLYASGPILSPPGGQFGKLFPADSFVIDQEYRVIQNAEDARAAVLAHIKQGVSVIKVCMNTYNRVLAPDEIRAIVQTAHAHHIPVTAHATFDESARDAVVAGVDGIEHGYVLSDSTLLLMAARNVYLVPTDVSRAKGKRLVAGIGMKGKEADDYLTTNIDAFHDRLRRAVKQGVMIVSGADYYNDVKGIERGKGAVDVLLAYHEAGIPVNEVVSFATANAARALGISTEYGCLKKGMKANLVAFAGDMERDFAESLFSTQLVIHEGQIVYNAVE